MNSLPNHPNYHLGPVDGSVCDSLGINAGLTPGPSPGERAGIRAHPNPSTGAFTLSYPAQPMVGELEVRDLSGRIVLHERLPPWSQVHRVQLVGASIGLYNCRIGWGIHSASTRIMIAGPR
ncbi:MAG: T9SS type A sorting domain-containing protein [Flavobacteriales bacterium]|nr:T9SS type A sorting domain-containing protein [Flavobacteriales bacterium]